MTELLTVIGTGVAILAVLVPLILTLHTRQAADLAELRQDLAGRIDRINERIDRHLEQHARLAPPEPSP